MIQNECRVMMKFVQNVPLAVSGLALGLAALGNLLLPLGVGVRYFCGVLSAVVLTCFVLRVVMDFSKVREEWKTSGPLSVLPTSTMAFMILCTYLRPYFGVVMVFLWYGAVVMHIFIMAVFFKRFIIGFKIENVFPSWFVVFVGIVTVSVTAPIMDTRVVGQIAFYIGFPLYFVALCLIIYRLTRPIPVPEPLRLTTAIFTAPMSLCIVGYFSSFDVQNEYLVYMLLCLATVSYIFVFFKMVTEYLRVKFYPTYSAFTFPFVISATAFRIGNLYLAERGITFFAPVAEISMWIAVAAVTYVLIHYLKYFWDVMKSN